jgi:hypothetical protein
MKNTLPLIALIGLSACGDKIYWTNAPSDPQVEAYLFDQCLTKARGPIRTHYNDLDEMVEQCSRSAAIKSKFCPEKLQCAPDLLPRADVRAILPDERKQP